MLLTQNNFFTYEAYNKTHITSYFFHVDWLNFHAYDKLFFIVATIYCTHISLYAIFYSSQLSHIKVQKLFLLKHKYPYDYCNRNLDLD